MKRKAYGRDAGLTLRMLLTSSLLGLLYVAFALVLFYVFNAGLVLMVVIVGGMAIFQYFTSDKLALAASGAKIVSTVVPISPVLNRPASLATWPVSAAGSLIAPSLSCPFGIVVTT